jgi:hypothetical protein
MMRFVDHRNVMHYGPARDTALCGRPPAGTTWLDPAPRDYTTDTQPDPVHDSVCTVCARELVR